MSLSALYEQIEKSEILGWTALMDVIHPSSNAERDATSGYLTTE